MGITERKAREREQRSAAIIDAAETMALGHGIPSITMDAVAEAAEVSKGTLYLYFKSKEDLFMAVMYRSGEMMRAAMREAGEGSGSGLERIKAYGRVYLETHKRDPRTFQLMMLFHSYFHSTMGFSNADAIDTPYGRLIMQQSREMLAEMIEMLQAGIADGSIRNRMPPQVLAVLLAGMSNGMLEMISHAKTDEGKPFIEAGFPMDIDGLVNHTLQFIGISLATDPLTVFPSGS